jgi:membrane protein YqaA with SNARE-associated domain
VQLVWVALIVFGINLMPAFAPPTWAVLVLLQLSYHLPTVPLVIVGAISAATGRYVLALAFRYGRRWLPKTYVANTQAAGELLLQHKGRSLLGMIVFLISPLPSAQLFEAAGLMAVPLLPLCAAFFVGRLVTYSVYAAGANAVSHTDFGKLLINQLTSPWGIALQVSAVVGLVLLGRVNWARFKKPDQTSGAHVSS